MAVVQTIVQSSRGNPTGGMILLEKIDRAQISDGTSEKTKEGVLGRAQNRHGNPRLRPPGGIARRGSARSMRRSCRPPAPLPNFRIACNKRCVADEDGSPSGKPINLRHSSGCKRLTRPSTKYIPVFAPIPPPKAESVMACPLGL